MTQETATDTSRPLPNVTPQTEPFWAAARENRFVLFRCKQCGAWYWPPAFCRFHDNEAFMGNLEWTEASGRGKVFTFDVIRRQMHPAFPVPYVYGLIETEEGPLFSANVVDCEPDEVYVGMPVEVTFEKISDEFTLPQFRPARSSR
jgi:uncharacterized OB-fold protein